MACGPLLPAIRQLTGAVLDLVFPPRCGGCQAQGARLCFNCQTACTIVGVLGCPRCGRLLESEPGPAKSSRMGSMSTTHDCRPLALDGILVAVLFEGVTRNAIHALKYNRRRDLARPLGDFMVTAWHTRPLPVDMITPVPLHPARVQQRGYNQSALLGEELARSLQLPLDLNALRRVRQTPPQVGLNRTERRANVAGAFIAQPEAVHGRSVLLIDDVYTTGATLEACAAALRQAGVEAAYAFVLAHPRPADDRL